MVDHPDKPNSSPAPGNVVDIEIYRLKRAARNIRAHGVEPYAPPPPEAEPASPAEGQRQD